MRQDQPRVGAAQALGGVGRGDRLREVGGMVMASSF